MKPTALTSKKSIMDLTNWVNRETTRFKEDELESWPAMGATDLQAEMKAYWKQNRPQMYRRLMTARLLNKMAYVLECKMWEQEAKNQAAGMPWPDSRNQAQQDWLLMDPEEESENHE